MSDVWGPAKVEPIGKWKYYISFNNDSARYGTVLFLHMKGNATQRIKEHANKIKQCFGKALTFLQVDNGKELVNEEVKKFCTEEGITIEISAPYSPSQNGIAKHFN